MDTPSLVDVTLPVTGLQYTIGLDWSGERNAFYWCDYLNGTVNVATLEVRSHTSTLAYTVNNVTMTSCRVITNEY